MLLVVFIHAYNLPARYLQPWTTPAEPLTPTAFTEYFLANGLFRFVIPLLFAISGYLFALKDEAPHRQRLRKRARVLLLPYLVWSAFALLFVYALELFPYTRSLVLHSRIVQVSNDRLLLHDYYWYELLARWILVPVAYQLWFIRALIMYNLAYPFIRWCILYKTARWVFFGIASLLWLATADILLVEGEGLLFFSLGIWLQQEKVNIEIPSRFTAPALYGIACLLLCGCKTVLAFRGQAWLGDAVFPVLILLHKLSVVCGLVAVWYGSNRLARWCAGRQWFAKLSSFSFIIYMVHAPAVAIFIDALFAGLHYTYGYRIITFVLLPLLLIVLSIAFGATLKRAVPKLYSVATGGRG